jgi:hypothetical protein
MAYNYEKLILHDVKPLTNPGPPFRHEAMKELQEVYRKAKILDEVKNFTTERLKEQKLTDEYDFGERLMCEEIKEIIGGQTK